MYQVGQPCISAAEPRESVANSVAQAVVGSRDYRSPPWLVLWAIDLPAPFILGLLIGGFSVIPFAGAIVGGVPALLLAAGTLDIGRVLAVVALAVAVQLFEVFLVRRRVDGVTLYVGPALPLIVALSVGTSTDWAARSTACCC